MNRLEKQQVSVDQSKGLATYVTLVYSTCQEVSSFTTAFWPCIFGGARPMRCSGEESVGFIC